MFLLQAVYYSRRNLAIKNMILSKAKLILLSMTAIGNIKLEINNVVIEKISAFEYLRTWIMSDANYFKEMKTRYEIVRSTFPKLLSLLTLQLCILAYYTELDLKTTKRRKYKRLRDCSIQEAFPG